MAHNRKALQQEAIHKLRACETVLQRQPIIDNMKQLGLLRGADLSGLTLRGILITKADMRGAILRGVDFQEARLLQVDLREADLSHANLQLAYLNNADCAEADLSDAQLQRARLINVHLRGATLTGAIFDEKTALPDASTERDTEGRAMWDTRAKLRYRNSWSPDVDMTRYTDPDHPDFWQPDWV